MIFSFVFVTGLRSGQKDDDEVFSETCKNSSVSLLSGNSSCHKVRSSRPCVGRFPQGLDDLTLWHDEFSRPWGNATIFTCFAEQIVEGWTQNEIRSRTREEREWRREKGQKTRSHKQNPKFLEVENATSEKFDFFNKKHMFFHFFLKNATSEKQKKQLLNFFWTDRFRETIFGAGDPNFRQSADCRKFASLDRMDAATTT